VSTTPPSGRRSPSARRQFLSFILVMLLVAGAVPQGKMRVASASERPPVQAAATINDVIINEVDSDTPGTDAAEFVELYDGGAGNTPLTGLCLVFYNGSNDQSYFAVDLTGTTNASGYYTIGNAGGTGVDQTFGGNVLQNGQDAVALYVASASSFPTGTAVTTTNLSDAVVYDTADADDAGLLVLLNTGQPQVDEDAGGGGANNSIQRCPNGSGGKRNTSTYAPQAPTPDAVNTCVVATPTPTPVPTPSLTINNVSQAEGNAGTTTFTFTISLTPAAATDVTFDIATADGTAQDDNPTTEDNDYVAKTETGRTITAGATSATFTVSVNGDTLTEANETFFVNITNVVGAAVGDGQGLGTINNDDATQRAIFTIQGSSTASPFVGTQVTTTGIVTARRSFGASNNGFYIQDPNGDGNVNTSDAILVFTGSTVPTVNVGDSVQVTGTIEEFEASDTDEPNGVTPVPDPKTATELVGPLTISVLSTGNSLPAALTAAIFDPNAQSRGAELEKYEYMRVGVSSLTVYQPTNNFGEFWGVLTGQPRPFREPGIERGDPVPAADQGPHAGSPPPNVPIFDGNFERIMVNSGSALLPASSTRRAQVQVTTGTVVTGIIGPLDYAFDNYQIILDYNVTPGTSGGITAAVPVPTPLAGEFTIASANLENFTNNASRLNKASLAIRNVMRTPDVLGVIEVLDQATLTALANKINTDAANPSAVNYQAFLSETAATQDIGFLVNTARVTLVGTPTAQFVGKTFTYAGESDTLHDRPPFILTVDVPQTNNPTPLRVTVILNHTKSLIAVDSPRPRGTGGTEGGRNREKRRLQAEDIADLIQARKDENLVMMGDLNAFDFNDGLGDVVGTMKGTPAPPDQVVEPSTDRWTYNLYNSLSLLPADQQYSLLFEGNAQALDHILVNNKMRARQSRFAYARFNADFSEAYADDANRPERLSDHDAGVSYFTTGVSAQAGPVLISEFRFNGPNGTGDEFIELYNNTDTQVSVNGWRIVAPSGTGGGGVVITGPRTSILPRGHLLIAPSDYSVSGYPASTGIFATAAPDVTYTGGAFLDDGGAQLENAAGEIIDAVGFASVNGTNFREGAGLSPASGVTPTASDQQYSFVRKLTSGVPQDTNDNAADFVLVSTTGNVGSTVSLLGAPGPETTESPIQRNGVIKATAIDSCTGAGICENRRRIGTPVPNGAFGTLKIRRKFTNTTPGENVTRLRFRVVDMTTLNSPGYAPGNGQADLRVVPSDASNFTVTTSTGENVPIEGTQVETPPAQPLGGGVNSSIVLIMQREIAPGEQVNVEFNLGVMQNGSFRFFVNVEALTADLPSLPLGATSSRKATIKKQ
jgi:predicted extracellular nuclease